MRAKGILLLALALMGCASPGEGPVTEPEVATTVAHRAWGESFDEKQYDVWRELAHEERAFLDKSYSEKYGFESHVGPRIFASNVKPPFVIDQLQRLRPGCAISLNAVDAPKNPPRTYLVIWRRESGAFSWSWQHAWSPQEALSQGKTAPEAAKP